MKDYLIIKLQGPMQSWGEHSFEGLRPSSFIPTRSAILGLLGACLGVRRGNQEDLLKLDRCLGIAVRIDNRKLGDDCQKALIHQKLSDYHTILGARKEYHGLKKHETIQTWREYLLDAEFSVVLWDKKRTSSLLDDLESHIQKPVFTPYLGRRCCPIGRPLFEARIQSKNEFRVFDKIDPKGGPIFSETPDTSKRSLKFRDVPLNRPRQFGTRIIYIYGGNYALE